MKWTRKPPPVNSQTRYYWHRDHPEAKAYIAMVWAGTARNMHDWYATWEPFKYFGHDSEWAGPIKEPTE